MIASLTVQELEALRLIGNRHLSCASLAGELKISRATASKIIAELRKKGLRISTTRDSGGWFYLLHAQPDPNLSELVGIGGTGRKNYSMLVDEELLEHLSGRNKKKQAMAR